MFQPAKKKKKYLKIMVYGTSGNGKTHFGLTFPKCAVVDSESGTDFFSERDDIEPFDVLPARSYQEASKGIDYLEQFGQTKYLSLLIDSMTRIYNNLKVTGQKVAEDRALKFRKSVDDAGLTHREWGIIGLRYESLMDRLYNLPFNTIITCWLKDVYRSGEKIGVTYDCDKKTEYQADIILRMEVDDQGNFWGIIEKDRTGFFPKMSKIKNPSYQTFKPVLDRYAEGNYHPVQTTEQAIEKDRELFADTTNYQQSSDENEETTVPIPPRRQPGKKIEWTPDDLAEIEEAKRILGLSSEDTKAIFLNECGGNKEQFISTLRNDVRFKLTEQEVIQPEPVAEPEPEIKPEPVYNVVTITPPETKREESVENPQSQVNKPKSPFTFAESETVKSYNQVLKMSQKEIGRLFMKDCEGNKTAFFAKLQEMVSLKTAA